MAGGVATLIQQHTLPQALGQGNALLQSFMKTRAMPEQIKNSLLQGQANATKAQNEAQYGSGQYGQILTALNNPNVSENQKKALQTALTINSLYRPGMPNDPTAQAIRSGSIVQDPNLSNTVQTGSGQSAPELYKTQEDQYKAKTKEQLARAHENEQRGNYYEKGGAKGSFIDYLMNNPDVKGVISPEMLSQAVGSTLTMGAPAAVKAEAAANIAVKYGNTNLADSVDKWQTKQGTTSAILNKLAGYDMIDKGFETVMPRYIPIMQYYSGPQGALNLKADMANAALGRPTSPEYDKYKTFATTVLPTLADQLRKTWGASVTPEINAQLQGIIGFKNTWDQIQQNPKIIMDRFNELQTLLGAEVSALEDYKAPSITGSKEGAKDNTDQVESQEGYGGYSKSDIDAYASQAGITPEQVVAAMKAKGVK